MGLSCPLPCGPGFIQFRMLRLAAGVPYTAGMSPTGHPRRGDLTTQQAADLLAVSRPHVVKLIEQGRLPAHRAGTHRRVRLADVLAYRERSQPRRPLDAAARPARAAKRRHDWIDERSRALGTAIAARLVDEPALLRRALHRVRERCRDASPRDRGLLRRWEALLASGSLAEVVATLTGPADAAARLRQVHPFTDVLTTTERNAIFRYYETL